MTRNLTSRLYRLEHRKPAADDRSNITIRWVEFETGAIMATVTPPPSQRADYRHGLDGMPILDEPHR